MIVISTAEPSRHLRCPTILRRHVCRARQHFADRAVSLSRSTDEHLAGSRHQHGPDG